MGCVQAPPAPQSVFALVSYIPDPLGVFLDRLRLELVPNCSPHAHVTILPPRPIQEDPDLAASQLREISTRFPDFDILLGDVEIFPVSKVIYISIATGENQLRAMYSALNQGACQYREPFPYHPHITLAQNTDPSEVDALYALARHRWAEYSGPRSFHVGTLDFVRNLYGSCWKDLANISLAGQTA